MEMILAYNPLSSENHYVEQNKYYLNLHWYIFTLTRAQEEQFKQDVSAVLKHSDTIAGISFSLENLNDNIRATLRTTSPISYDSYSKIQNFIVIFVALCSTKTHNLPISKWSQPSCSSIQNWDRKLYVRYGNVELRAIDSLILNSQNVLDVFDSISLNLADEQYMYSDGRPKHWLDSSDANFNVRRLMTNAGFYFDAQNAAEDFRRWSESYLNGLVAADYFFTHDAYAYFFRTQELLFQRSSRLCPYLQFPSRSTFYDTIREKSVLIVSPFAKEIEFLFSSGKLFGLYKDALLPQFTVHTVFSAISTYPNRPHTSWSATFQDLCSRIDNVFENTHVDIFFASAGCYGIPICHYVHCKYGCTSVYYGHYINSLFGILTGPKALIPELANLDNWLGGDLKLIKNVSRIDGGRYT